MPKRFLETKLNSLAENRYARFAFFSVLFVLVVIYFLKYNP